MSKAIAVVNQKGGVAKTFTSNTLSVGLVRRGYKVLAVDGDMQADLTFAFGLNPEALDMTLTECIKSEIADLDYDVHDAIYKADNGVDVLPASIEMATLELSIISVMQREYLVSKVIERVRDEYDFIIIDCPPTLGMITVNLLTAADGVLIPANADAYSIKGMKQLVSSVMKIKKGTNPDITIYGILFTMVRPNTVVNREFMEGVRQTYGHLIKVYDSFIPLAVIATEAVSDKVSIFDKAPDSAVAAAYTSFIDEFLEEVE